MPTQFDQTVMGLTRQDTEIHHRTRPTPDPIAPLHLCVFASLR